MRVFSALDTQWTLAPDGQPLGLPTPSIESAMRLQRMARGDWPELFDDVRVMEAAALKHLRRNRK